MPENVGIRKIVKENCACHEKWQNSKDLDIEFMKTSLRQDFILPKSKGKDEEEFVYICGNSLGPQPKRFNEIILNESETWAKHAVNGHLDNPSGRNWVDWDFLLLDDFKKMLNAESIKEIAVNSTLTTNLHNLLIYFYKPTKERYKIITDSMSFPSDYYTLESQLKLHGFDPKEALIEVQPRNLVDKIIQDEDIISIIKEHGSSVALVMLSGVQYLSGQFFDLKQISKAAKTVGAVVGFDLAHVIGNVPINLEEIEADFAVWCTYKYLNSGPGSVGGYYVNRKHHEDILKGAGNILAGWWGVDLKKTAKSLNTCGLVASLESFEKMEVSIIRDRSFILTEYFRKLFLKESLNENIKIITPKDKKRSGAQISIAFKNRDETIRTFNGLSDLGIMTDRREPDIIRLTFTGLYNSHEDVFMTIEGLKLLKSEH